MSRRAAFVSVLTLFALVALGLGLAYWSVTQAPSFYVEELQRPVEPEVQKAQAKEFVQATMQLVDEIRYDDEWSEQFSQEQINSWLAEELPKKYAKWIPKGTSDPRIRLDAEAVEIAFRCEHPRFQGVISARLKPFVSGPNELAIKVLSVSLGLVPLPIDQVLDQIGGNLQKTVTDAGGRMEWRQMEGSDVLVIHLNDQADKPVLQAVRLAKGTLEISGSRNEGQKTPTNVVPFGPSMVARPVTRK